MSQNNGGSQSNTFVTGMVLYHRTDIYNAYRKAVSKQTWSKDASAQANFHTQTHGGGSDCKNEITLHFEWTGAYSSGSPSRWPGGPNVLFPVNWEFSSCLWSLVLFPGTQSGLRLTGYSCVEIPDDADAEHKNFLLEKLKELLAQPVDISVPLQHEQTMVPIPSLPQKGWISSLWEKLS